jgi:hypothetical protein
MNDVQSIILYATVVKNEDIPGNFPASCGDNWCDPSFDGLGEMEWADCTQLVVVPGRTSSILF